MKGTGLQINPRLGISIPSDTDRELQGTLEMEPNLPISQIRKLKPKEKKSL